MELRSVGASANATQRSYVVRCRKPRTMELRSVGARFRPAPQSTQQELRGTARVRACREPVRMHRLTRFGTTSGD